MKFVKKTKKGFTLVELVVVIAIIAILSGVSVAVYVSVTNKAKQTADSEIISQLNLQMKAQGVFGNNNTCYDAYLDAKDIGFDLALMHPQYGDRYVWDQETDRFAVIKGNEVIAQDKEAPLDMKEENRYKQWVFVENPSSTETRSQFLTDEDYDSNVSVKSGFDTGLNKLVTSVSYSNSGTKKEVIIRTNTEGITLNVDAPTDTVKHFDKVGIVNIARTANASYHEYGIANYVENASGRVVAEDGGLIKTCVLTEKGASATLDAVAEEDGGTIENCYATKNAVATANNDESSKNVRLVVSPVSEQGNVLAEGKTTEQTKAIVESKKDEVAAEANNNKYSEITGVARIGGTGYDTLTAAFAAVEDGQVIVFLKNIKHNDNFLFNKNVTAIIDLAGHTLQTTGATNGGRSIKITAGNVTVKNGTIDGRSYNGESLNPNPSGKGPWSNTRAGGCIRLCGGTALLENLKMYNNDGWGNAVKVDGKYTLTMRGCFIESVYGDCIEVCEGTANIYDCNFRQSFTPNNSYMANCVAVSYLGVANIYDSTMEKDEEGNLVNGSTDGHGVCPLFVYDSGGVINVDGGHFKTTLSNVIEIDATNTNKYIVTEQEYTQQEYDAFVSKYGGSAVINVKNVIMEGNAKISGVVNGDNTATTKFNVYSGSFTIDVTKYKVN